MGNWFKLRRSAPAQANKGKGAKGRFADIEGAGGVTGKVCSKRGRKQTTEKKMCRWKEEYKRTDPNTGVARKVSFG